jgi:hypothetical protein
VGLDQDPDCERETMGRHRSFPAGKQHLALRDDPAPAAQDLTPRSSERLVSDAAAGAGGALLALGRRRRKHQEVEKDFHCERID